MATLTTLILSVVLNGSCSSRSSPLNGFVRLLSILKAPLVTEIDIYIIMNIESAYPSVVSADWTILDLALYEFLEIGRVKRGEGDANVHFVFGQGRWLPKQQEDLVIPSVSAVLPLSDRLCVCTFSVVGWANPHAEI